jgi:hypothetical protein
LPVLRRYPIVAWLLVATSALSRIASGQEPKAERVETIGPVRAEEEIVLESVSSRETVAASALPTILLARGADGKDVLCWGPAQEKKAPIENLLLIRFPAPRAAAGARPAAALTIFLRDGAELRGGIVQKGPKPGTKEHPGGESPKASDAVTFQCRALGSEPYQIPLEAIQGVLVHVAGASPGGATRPPDDAAKSPGEAPVSPGEPGASPGGSTGGSTGQGKPSRARRSSPGSDATSPSSIRLRNEILRTKPKKDILVLLEEGRMEGLLESMGPDGIRFSSETLGDVRVAYDKVRAVILAEVGAEPADHGADAKKPAPKDAGSSKGAGADGAGAAGAQAASNRVRATLRDGTILPARLTSVREGVLALRHPDLGDLSVPLAETIELAFLGGRLSYLSDRDPKLVKETLPASFRENARPFQRDASVMEGPLRMAGREYRKGLGVHAHSLLEYDLKGEYSRFQATIGLDESARPMHPDVSGTEGSVVFRVRVDGKPLFEKPMTWRDAPAALDLPIQGGSTLSLEVDCGVPGDVASILNFALDRADWAEARIIK